MIKCFRCEVNFHDDTQISCEDCLPFLGADIAALDVQESIQRLEHVEAKYLKQRIAILRRASDYLQIIVQHLEKQP